MPFVGAVLPALRQIRVPLLNAPVRGSPALLRRTDALCWSWCCPARCASAALCQPSQGATDWVTRTCGTREGFGLLQPHRRRLCCPLLEASSHAVALLLLSPKPSACAACPVSGPALRGSAEWAEPCTGWLRLAQVAVNWCRGSGQAPSCPRAPAPPLRFAASGTAQHSEAKCLMSVHRG